MSQAYIMFMTRNVFSDVTVHKFHHLIQQDYEIDTAHTLLKQATRMVWNH